MLTGVNATGGTLVFDGDCGFCTRSLGWLRLLDTKRRVTTAPFQRPDAPGMVDATPELCAAAVRWKGVDGTTAGGAAAINAALSAALNTDVPVRLYRHTRAAQEGLYDWVARNRGRLPGMTPWCDRFPADCGRS
ncbi:thiol-disulfide oxidoreductase DCC family protein [Pseudonocardia sp. H11422]|uniref:thiol-disulfide oxidoreductase DCC family protein n=1 Tax=Pseudonocardia sp. H11422 TaxID=2835866 RepID=UPI001BDC71F8|nr:DCC1-like thiol-disulfide oxidoreductase family protein [Pseudonocardia sp. H11422]